MMALDLRFIRFLTAGLVATAFNLAGRVALSAFVDFNLSIVGAQLAGMLVAYLAMRCLVFEPSARSPVAELARFAVVNVFSLAQIWAVSFTLVAVIPSALASLSYREFMAHFLGLGTTAFTSFFLHRSFTFGVACPETRALTSANPEIAGSFEEMSAALPGGPGRDAYAVPAPPR